MMYTLNAPKQLTCWSLQWTPPQHTHKWLKNKNEYDKKRYYRIIFFGIKYFYAL